jgi:hypothetical protein
MDTPKKSNTIKTLKTITKLLSIGYTVLTIVIMIMQIFDSD